MLDPIQEVGVVTFGSFRAGTTNNVIAETFAEVYGTIRTLYSGNESPLSRSVCARLQKV